MPPEGLGRWEPQRFIFGRRLFALDELNAPLVPAVALLHFLTALATARMMMRRFSISWALAAETISLASFSCKEPWVLVGLLVASTVAPYLELRRRERPTRVYLLHMGLFVGLLIAGWAGVEAAVVPGEPPTWAILLLLTAVLVRCGTVPAHCWLTDWIENASFGNVLLFVVPLSGVYAAARLLLPIGPDWAFRLIGIASLATAVYAAGHPRRQACGVIVGQGAPGGVIGLEEEAGARDARKPRFEVEPVEPTALEDRGEGVRIELTEARGERSQRGRVPPVPQPDRPAARLGDGDFGQCGGEIVLRAGRAGEIPVALKEAQV